MLACHVGRVCNVRYAKVCTSCHSYLTLPYFQLSKVNILRLITLAGKVDGNYLFTCLPVL